MWTLTGGMQVEFRQGYKDPSKAAATVARPEERADLGHRMQGTVGAEAGAGQGGKSTWASSLHCIVQSIQVIQYR